MPTACARRRTSFQCEHTIDDAGDSRATWYTAVSEALVVTVRFCVVTPLDQLTNSNTVELITPFLEANRPTVWPRMRVAAAGICTGVLCRKPNMPAGEEVMDTVIKEGNTSTTANPESPRLSAAIATIRM